jgi:hypothetical protein
VTDIRDERAAALKRWHRDMGDNFTATLPKVLDALEAIDQARMADQADQVDAAYVYVPAPTDEQVAAWIERNPKAFADWAARQVKVTTTATATRRRTTR